MKIVSYNFKQRPWEKPRLGLMITRNKQEFILDPNYSYAHSFHGVYHSPAIKADLYCPSLLSQLLKQSLDPIDVLQKALALPENHQQFFPFHKEHIKLHAPIDHINLYRDFFTHEKHVATGFKKRNEPIPEAWFEIPAYYKGSQAQFMGDGDLITWPQYTDMLDYELELGLVMARDGKNIKASKAKDHVLGFTILNDISARDIQRKEMSIRLGPSKGKDFCSVLGPMILTLDEFKNQNDVLNPRLKMQAKINGELWSEGFSHEAHYSWEEMIEFASNEEWLLASDLLGSGTVGTGCGLELDRWIKPGDKIELVIEQIGTLSNIVGQKNG